MYLSKILSLIFILLVGNVYSQNELKIDLVKKHTKYFKINPKLNFIEDFESFLIDEARNNQFIGIAEVHQSEQLSFFTTAYLKILKKTGFSNFALEMGEYSATILEELSIEPRKTKENIKKISKIYGKRRFPYIPFIFADKETDALFIAEASKQNYDLWGIDREYEFTYEMHFDELYKKSSKSIEVTNAYKKTKKLIKKIVFKDKINGQSKYCWLKNSDIVKKYFSALSNDTILKNYVNELENSFDIYCRFIQKKGGSLARAKYMRKKFDSLYKIASKKEDLPKVLVKLGGVHLTHGNSVYGRYDVGRHLYEKAKKNNTNFLAIRHIYRYRNGRDLINKKAWESTKFLMQLGKKDEWTLIDLRPIRKIVKEQNLVVDKGTAWELKSYDWFLITPNDSKVKLNR